MILSFLDIMPNRSYPLAEASWAFIRWAFCLEANLNVKREMSESFGKLSAERQAQAVRSVRFYYMIWLQDSRESPELRGGSLQPERRLGNTARRREARRVIPETRMRGRRPRGRGAARRYQAS